MQAALAQNCMHQDALSAQNSIINSTILAPFHDIIIYVKHQAKGNFTCVEGVRIPVGDRQRRVWSFLLIRLLTFMLQAQDGRMGWRARI